MFADLFVFHRKKMLVTVYNRCPLTPSVDGSYNVRDHTGYVWSI